MYNYPEKISLGLFPTPLHKLEHISKITGVNIYLKRDDLRGIAFGGNKLRKLEYILADAKKQGCDCIITAGGSTSNQTVAAALCANKAGLEAHIVVPATTKAVTMKLLEFSGAAVHIAQDSSFLKKEMKAVEKRLKSTGKKPYIIPIGASCPLGVVGYADAVREIYRQAEEMGITIHHTVCSGASGNTYSGILLGTKLYLPHARATVISAARRFARRETLCKNALNAARLIGAETEITEDDVNIHFCSGKGIDDLSPKGKQAVSFMAQQEGIYLDPVYTGKGFAGLLELAENGYFSPGENIVFIHSGGTVSLMNSLI